MRATLLFVVAGLAAAIAVAQPPDVFGRSVADRPVVEVIEDLRDAGTRVVYSEDLLPIRLRVLTDPTAADAFENLRQILAPHGLDVELGPRETWLIVRRRPSVDPTDPLAGAVTPDVLPPALDTIVVTTSRYAIERPSAISANAISRHRLENTPALGQDPLRVTQSFPGVTSNQLTSQMHVRGGELDEVIVLLDGVRLFSPYHLKDFQNIFSSINPRIVESIDFRTGGYEARYGDGLSGVVDMQSIVPSEFRHHEIGLSMLETGVMSSGLFDNGRGSWITALRRSNLDVTTSATDSDIGHPQFVDFFSRLRYSPGSGSTLGLGILSLGDKLDFRDGTEAAATADNNDVYYWLSLERNAESGIEAAYRLASAHLDRRRDGIIQDPERATGWLAEDSGFNRSTLTADWSYRQSDSLRFAWGVELADIELDHRFQSERSNLQPIEVADLTGPSMPPPAIRVRLNQATRAFYMSFRVRPISRLVTEVGYRWDDQSISGEHQVSPRLNLLFDLFDRTTLRAAWGDFAQSQSLDRIAVADGIAMPELAEKSEHLVFGIEHEFGETGTFRFESYVKTISRLNARFENVFERVSLIPELLPDRFRIDPLSAKVRGFEFSVNRGSEPFSWSASLSRSRTEERLPGGKFRRSWDELWALKAGGEWAGSLWTVTVNGTYRSGWPISTLAQDGAILRSDAYNELRLPDFSSVDVRASRAVATENGQLTWYIEINNLLDRDNYCCLDYRFVTSGGGAPAALSSERDALYGIVPNVGLRWEF